MSLALIYARPKQEKHLVLGFFGTCQFFVSFLSSSAFLRINGTYVYIHMVGHVHTYIVGHRDKSIHC